MAARPTLAIYWASSCGGCEIAFANLHDRLLDLDARFQLVFCPCLMDAKTKDLRSMPDGGIDITLFNGAVRTKENEEMAALMRRKSRVLVAYGACAAGGGVPALSNLSTAEEHFASIYLENPSIDNPARTLPREATRVPEGELRLPRFYERVKTLAQTVSVDYTIPGCPPEPQTIWNALVPFVQGGELPPAGAILGAGRSSVCDECRKTRKDKKITSLGRFHEIAPDSETCLLEQGILCMGVATRDGCGALCPEVNMPCAGCYGPPEGVHDQGAKMAGALGAILEIETQKGRTAEEVCRRVDSLIRKVPDPAGTFYKFGLASSLLAGASRRRKAGAKE